ncbi:hypothetical protein K2X33_00605 [bacterium]|nr:hypothetical protein [bacterium]
MKKSTSLFFAASLLLLAACGASEMSTGNQNNPPPSTDGGSLGSNPGIGTQAGLAFWFGKSVEITRPVGVSDNMFLSQIQQMFLQVPSIPLVETHIAVQIDDSRSTAPTGRIFLGIEDQDGFLGGLIETVTITNLSSQSTNDLDMTFTDPQVALRVYAARTSDGKIAGTVYYRPRGSDTTTCYKKTYTCQKQVPVTDPKTGIVTTITTTVDNSYCKDIPTKQAADITACRNFVTLSSMTKLGTFEAMYSNWVK